MADYWKSQPRKFCQYCKCWIADNKPSVEFHERGKNHKENVAAKISEIKKKSVEKAKQDARMCKQFAAMEEAALKAYEEDLKRMERESSGSSSPAQASSPAQVSYPTQATSTSTSRPGPQPQPKPKPQQQRKSQPKKQQRKIERARQQTEMPVWVEGVTDDGQLYYYNTVTGESQWDKPGGFQGESSAPAQSEQTESSGSAWMEAVSPDGFTYYYNTETGESSWENPAGLASNEASGGGSGSNREEGGEKEEDEEEPSAPEPEPLSGGEESSDGAQASQEAAVPEQASQQPKVPKISFRKRKAEAEPLEKEGDDKAGDDAPGETDDKDAKTEEEVQSTAIEPEKTEEVVTQAARQAKKPKTANPYGAWEQIKEEEDPYSKVDLQLPQVEEAASSTPSDLPPEPKPKFRERIITSLGEEGGPASFKKNKTQNSRSRSLRQRDNDD